jgi:GT2 family glycosyltransferase
MNKTLSVVIPVFNHWNFTHQLIANLKSSFYPMEEIIIVNDASTSVDTATGVAFWKRTGLLTIKYIELEENVGFTLAANIGLQAAKGDIIVLANNDIKIEGKNTRLWLEKSLTRNMLAGGKVYRNDTGWNRFGGSIVPYVDGYFLAAYKETWKDLGYFDPAYAPGDFEEIDLARKAMMEQCDLVEIPNNGITHFGAQSYGYTDERRERTVRNREYFKKKWSF